MATVRAHAVATRSGGLGSTHTSRSTSTATTTAAPLTSTHLSHLLRFPTSSPSTTGLAGAGRCCAAFLSPAASMTRLSGCLPAHHVRGREHPLMQGTAAVWTARYVAVLAHQYFHVTTAVRASVLVDRHGPFLPIARTSCIAPASCADRFVAACNNPRWRYVGLWLPG